MYDNQSVRKRVAGGSLRSGMTNEHSHHVLDNPRTAISVCFSSFEMEEMSAGADVLALIASLIRLGGNVAGDVIRQLVSRTVVEHLAPAFYRAVSVHPVRTRKVRPESLERA